MPRLVPTEQSSHSFYIRNDPINNDVVIFVHGVTGNSRSTWTSDHTEAFWPEMLTEDPVFNGNNVFVYGYDSPRLGQSLTIGELGANLRLVLSSNNIFRHERVAFLMHSMGGLIVRSFLTEYAREDYIERIKLLYFLATPTEGSLLSSVFGLMSQNPQFGQMAPADRANRLGEDLRRWLSARLDIASYCAYETEKTPSGLPGVELIIVPMGSALALCNRPPDPIPRANHITIAKPDSQEAPQYLAFREAFKECMPRHVAPLVTDLVRQYPFPTVKEADCYELLGVWRSEYVDQYQAQGKTPPYVPRQIDDALRNALKQRNFVLLVGPSKAGKTRTAYEALLNSAPLTPMVVPFAAEDLIKIVEALVKIERPLKGVLWLNDLEKFLSKGTLTLRVLSMALHKLEIRIVATMRSSEFNLWRESKDETGRDAQQVLERAEQIILEDQMTAQEERQARVMYPALNLARGLGESFIAGRQLKSRYNNGTSAVRAVVRAAHNWKKTGLTYPIQRQDLFSLFQRHFEHLEPTQDANEEAFRSGLEEARKPVERYSALIYKERTTEIAEEYYILDYVSDYLRETANPMLAEVWELALLRLKSAPDCIAVGYSALEQGQPTISERAWLNGRKSYGSSACAYNLGVLMSDHRRLQEAEQSYQEAIELSPRFARAHCNLGLCMAKQNRLDEGEEAFRKTIELGPEDPEPFEKAHKGLSDVLKKQGRWEEAREVLSKLERIKPNEASVPYDLAIILTHLDQREEAVQAYRRAIALDPQFAKAHCNIGALLRVLNRQVEAEEALRKAVDLGINDLEAYGHASFHLSQMLFEQGRWAEAEQALREAIRRQPEDADKHHLLGRVLMELKRWDEAFVAFNEAFRVEPQNQSYRDCVDVASRRMAEVLLPSSSPRAQQVLALGRREARRFDNNYVATEHLLLGLIKLGQGVAVNVLQNMGLDLESVRMEVEKHIGSPSETKTIGNFLLTPGVKKVLELATEEAEALNHSYIGTEHILLGLLREGEGVAAQVLKSLGVDPARTRTEILKELDPNFLLPESEAE